MRKKRQRSRVRNVKTFGILAMSFAIIAGCSGAIPLNHDTNAALQEQALKSVKVVKLIKQKIGDPLEHAGDVVSSVQFDVIAKAGGDVQQILKNRGDIVQEGEVILRLSSTDAQFERQKAALAVETAQNAIVKERDRARKDKDSQQRELSNSIQKMEQQLADQTRTYNKAKNDYDVGLATKAQVYAAEVQLKNTRLDLDQLKQKLSIPVPGESLTDLETQLKNAQLSLQQIDQTMGYLDVKAPVSGILTDMPFEAGMTVQQGTKAGQIQKLDPIKIKAQLSEAESKYVSGKTELTYYLPDTAPRYKGKISFLSKVIDPESKAYEIDLDVPNQDMALKPGMKVWMQLTEEQDQIVLTVPTYSLVKEGDDNYVFVLSGDTVEKRKVQLGRVNEPNQEVLSGVKEGEQVVVSEPNQLKDKEKIDHADVVEQK